MIGQKQQDTFKRYDDFIKSTANGRRLAESCGQHTVDTTQGTRSKLLSSIIDYNYNYSYSILPFVAILSHFSKIRLNLTLLSVVIVATCVGFLSLALYKVTLSR